MNYTNLPTEFPQNMIHKTFYSQILNHEIGYNIYLPPDYKKSRKKYSVMYHIHGWMGNESSEIYPLEEVYKNKQIITVFVNAISSEETYLGALLQIESIIINELISHVDSQYRTVTSREGRMLSGFSMGGNMAFYYAVKNYELFSSVISYAGTYHHLYHKDYPVGAAPEKASELYKDMMREERYLEENNILFLVQHNAEMIRGKLNIEIHIGTDDILFCDNEIIHMYLNLLNIPHTYKIFEGSGHELIKIL